MSEKVFNIYFNDLDEDAQKRILKYFNVKFPEAMGWDVFPVAYSLPYAVDTQERRKI